MRKRICVLIYAVFCSIFLLLACGQEKLLTKMKNEVPIYEGAKVLESYMPEENMSVIKIEVEASKASKKDILSFYKDAMTKKGWEIKLDKDYGGSGALMELVKKDWGTLSIQPLTKKTRKTGKIPVILNLSIK